MPAGRQSQESLPCRIGQGIQDILLNYSIGRAGQQRQKPFRQAHIYLRQYGNLPSGYFGKTQVTEEEGGGGSRM
jgi:hypothetical protein